MGYYIIDEQNNVYYRGGSYLKIDKFVKCKYSSFYYWEAERYLESLGWVSARIISEEELFIMRAMKDIIE